MKKIKLFIIGLVCLFVINVKADVELPHIIEHQVMVTNKNGTQCYENGEKIDTIIPYSTTLIVNNDIQGSFIYVHNNDYGCYVKYVDVSSKTQSFDINNEGVENINSTKAIVLVSGGLNMRKGPSVTYSVITPIPQYSVITVTKTAGTYWYYTTYNGKSGWITSINKYVGFESSEVLINYKKTNIYDSVGKKVLGTIPANTEITDYVKVLGDYYVNYNGIKGYITDEVFKKLDKPGKIRLTKDYVIYDENNQPIKKIMAGQELEYTMQAVDLDRGFYIPDRNITMEFDTNEFEYVNKATVSVKKRGYLGEGIFGEEKSEDITIPTNNIEDGVEDDPLPENNNMTTKDIIIICLLGGILLLLTAIAIIKLVNGKKHSEKKLNHYADDINEARKTIEKRINNNIKSDNNNKEV